MDIEIIRLQKLRTLLRFAIPSVIAMVLTSLINIVDGLFVGHGIGEDGIAAINLGLPIVYLFLGIGLMFGVGGISIAGRELGAGNISRCNQVFRQTILTALVTTVGLAVIMLPLLKPILSLMGVSERTGQYFMDYYKILLLELPLMVVNTCMGMFIRGEGKPGFAMLISILNVALNAVLDAVFVNVCGWGMKGVAFSSLLTVLIASVLSILYFVSKSKVFKFGRMEISATVLKETVLNGFSEFVGEMSMCVTMFAYNFVIMKQAGEHGISAFTIVGYVSYIFSMIIIGFGQGGVPLMSFSYGARDYELTVSIRRLAGRLVFLTSLVVIAVLFPLAGVYSGAFVESSIVCGMAKTGIRIFVWSFPFSALNVIGSFYFTSIGKAKESAVISALRGLVLLMICVIVLPQIFGMTGVWMAALITEFLTLLVTIRYYVTDRRATVCA